MQEQMKKTAAELIAESEAREGLTNSDRAELYLYDIVRTERPGKFIVKIVDPGKWWDGKEVALAAGEQPKAMAQSGDMKSVSTYAKCRLIGVSEPGTTYHFRSMEHTQEHGSPTTVQEVCELPEISREDAFRRISNPARDRSMVYRVVDGDAQRRSGDGWVSSNLPKLKEAKASAPTIPEWF